MKVAPVSHFETDQAGMQTNGFFQQLAENPRLQDFRAKYLRKTRTASRSGWSRTDFVELSGAALKPRPFRTVYKSKRLTNCIFPASCKVASHVELTIRTSRTRALPDSSSHEARDLPHPYTAFRNLSCSLTCVR